MGLFRKCFFSTQIILGVKLELDTGDQGPQAPWGTSSVQRVDQHPFLSLGAPQLHCPPRCWWGPSLLQRDWTAPIKQRHQQSSQCISGSISAMGSSPCPVLLFCPPGSPLGGGKAESRASAACCSRTWVWNAAGLNFVRPWYCAQICRRGASLASGFHPWYLL